MQQWFQCVPNISTASTVGYTLGYMLILSFVDMDCNDLE